MKKKLYKSATDVKICGVCAGIARYFGLDATLVRLLWVIGTVCSAGGGGILIYIICAIVMPAEPKEPPRDDYVDYTDRKDEDSRKN